MRAHPHPRLTCPASQSPTVQRLISGFVLRLSSFVVIFCFACAALPAAPSATVPPAPTSASDNPTAGAARRLTQVAAATRSSRATAASLTATQDAADALTTQAAAKVTQTALAVNTAAALATGQAMLAAKDAWPQRLLDSFANNELGWPTGLTADHSLSVTASIAD